MAEIPTIEALETLLRTRQAVLKVQAKRHIMWLHLCFDGPKCLTVQAPTLRECLDDAAAQIAAGRTDQ